MSAPLKLAGFGAVLGMLLGLGALVGGVLDPKAPGGDSARAASHEENGMAESAHEVHDLAVADDGVRLALDTPEVGRGRAKTLRFRILDQGGATVRDFDPEHTKRMHLIVVRRDLTGFQHLHPTQGADGAWSVPIEIADAGSYRVFADFTRDGTATTLATDLRVDGAAALEPLPAPAPTAVSDGGYEVRLDAGVARAEREAELRFTVTKDGRPVDTEPYLGAGGHLVALREGDLAFLHVHPTSEGDAIGFGATFPTEGRHRLFLQFQVDGVVQTVAFTQDVAR